MRAIVPGKCQIEAEPVPLWQVAGIWDREHSLKRIVFTLSGSKQCNVRGRQL